MSESRPSRALCIDLLTNLESALLHLAQCHDEEGRYGYRGVQGAHRKLKESLRHDIVCASTAATIDDCSGGNLRVGVTAHCRCGHVFCDDVIAGIGRGLVESRDPVAVASPPAPPRKPEPGPTEKDADKILVPDTTVAEKQTRAKWNGDTLLLPGHQFDLPSWRQTNRTDILIAIDRLARYRVEKFAETLKRISTEKSRWQAIEEALTQDAKDHE